MIFIGVLCDLTSSSVFLLHFFFILDTIQKVDLLTLICLLCSLFVTLGRLIVVSVSRCTRSILISDLLNSSLALKSHPIAMDLKVVPGTWLCNQAAALAFTVATQEFWQVVNVDILEHSVKVVCAQDLDLGSGLLVEETLDHRPDAFE